MGNYLNKIFILTFFCFSLSLSARETVYLASMEWPPFCGDDIPRQGAISEVIRQAYYIMGYDLKIEFFPMIRAVEMGKTERFSGYFPEYFTEEQEKDYYFSSAKLASAVGFAQNKAKPITWDKIDDLKPYTVGVVIGYVNTAELDAAIKAGKIKTDKWLNDAANLRKLVKQRIDLAVIDELVFSYLLKHDAFLRHNGDALEFNAHVLEKKILYICFNHTAKGKKNKEIFEAGLKKINPSAILNRYLQELTDAQR